MARRGPKPKPPTPAPPDGGPLWAGFEPPADLSDEARAEVARLVRALASVGTLGRTDPRVVVAAARTHDLIERATAELGVGLWREPAGPDGTDAGPAAPRTLTQVAANGTLMPHPMIAVLNTLTMRLRGLWSDMGLTAATARLGSDAKAETEANPWDGLLGIHAG